MLVRQTSRKCFFVSRNLSSKLVSSSKINTKSYFNCIFNTIFDFQRKNIHSHHLLYTDWDYSKEHGPERWQETWQLKNYQSPINIVTQSVEYDNNLKPLEIMRKPIDIHVRNLGFNISFLADNLKSLVLRGGPLSYNYAFRELHFHWGEVIKNQCNLSCEHTIDDKKYAAELHLVHWNTDLYETDLQALRSKDGITVLGVMIDASDSYEPNTEFNVIIDAFKNVLYPNDKHMINISPYFLLSSRVENYYTYSGSLTIPPLSENVTWVLFPDPIQISLDQLKSLNITYSVEPNSHSKPIHLTSDGSPIITNNSRPVQPLNNRVVRSSFKSLI
ncbi:carbonic anhydrase 1 [Hydra vulgaris]|uniref:carbonic anhydrase n=1 Tax=Hydra vulgaris TaxID=6087 RepID=A0ABM4D8H7_HYDVU